MSDPGAAHLVLTRGAPDVPWVGQLVRIDVALWRPHAGEGELPPFSFDELDVPGAIALFRAEAPPPSELAADGVRYLVQHRTLLVFPQQDGAIELPPITARFDDRDSKLPMRVKSEALRFEAALPHGLPAESALIVARGLELKSKTDRPLESLSVGDGFTRSFALSAEDTDPIMFPELVFTSASGLRVYPVEPRTLASAERGAVHASRTFSATYVIERVGHYELPGLSLRWLDPTTGRYATAHVEPLLFWAHPNPRLGLGAFGSAPGLGLGLALATALLLAALGYVVLRRLRSGAFAWERRLAARRRELRAFLAFERSLSRDAPLAILRRAYAWLALRLPGEARTLARLRAASAQSAQALGAWEEQAFAGRAVSVPSVPTHGLHRLFARTRRALAARGADHSVSDINPENEPRREKSWTTPE